eukprot:TRINITY_DN54662_c0_g1_i1.p1 TRINITY_DN54662_c0_g1~~TRINITY_DN54662_c0_g1_i1.p1  ORF type:complete len:526 (+),score=31.52 TRINITY_DN54662_c0_g1_i1:66-1580(+)
MSHPARLTLLRLSRISQPLPTGVRFFSSSAKGKKLKPMTSLVIHIARTHDQPGVAGSLLNILGKHSLNLANLHTQMSAFSYDGAAMWVDVRGRSEDDVKCQAAIKEIQAQGFAVRVLPPTDVPWFPSNLNELEDCVCDTIGGNSSNDTGESNEDNCTGGLLSPDHPGFNDAEYIKRRKYLAEVSNSYKLSDGKLPNIDYSDEEKRVWNTVYTRLKDCHKTWACAEYLETVKELELECGYGSVNGPPQLNDICEFLKSTTGFRMWPVTGLLSARDFLNCLAFRVFCSTQYIRHGANPFYTPEPDVIHELVGHVPLLADPAFAEFSQKVGLASLGASDEEIMKLANIYWFTIEFGLIRDPNDTEKVKVIGAGILSSFGEMEWSASSNALPSTECREMGGILKTHPNLLKPNLQDFDPFQCAEFEYPITTYQPTYFVGESIEDMKEKIEKYCDRMPKPFHPCYDPVTNTISPSRHVARMGRDNEEMVKRQGEKQKDYFDKIEAARRI